VTRIVLDPDLMEQASARLLTIAEELVRIAAEVSASLPFMPPDMDARYGDAIDAVAARARSFGDPLADLAHELRTRAQTPMVDGAASPELAGGRVAAVLTEPADGGPAAPDPERAAETTAGEPARAVHEAAAESPADAEQRAATHDGLGEAPPPPTPDDDADAQEWACWMASHAAHEGLPAALPLALALANSGLRNLDPHGAGVGFFGIAPDQDLAPPGFGLGSTTQPDAAWWQENPEAQLAHVLRRLNAVAPEGEAPTSAAALGGWAAEAEGGTDPEAVTGSLSIARTLVSRCRHGLDAPDAPVPAAAPAGALKVAEGQLGVREVGTNAGPQVDTYLAAASVPSGNPWCASFVKWAMQESGRPLPGTGWAAVSHWVDMAQQQTHGLQVVAAADARPGDVVAYDWGHGSDFGQDGHIGILASDVAADGTFTAVEGNAGDAVSRMQRALGEANVVFIRAGAAS
jgi:hypothetical protein